MEHTSNQHLSAQTLAIQELNDRYRMIIPASPNLLVSQGVRYLLGDFLSDVFRAVRDDNNFKLGNDPYREHDFGKVIVRKHIIFWKIDYYDNDLSYASPNPADQSLTKRVMTIYLAEEH